MCVCFVLGFVYWLTLLVLVCFDCYLLLGCLRRLVSWVNTFRLLIVLARASFGLGCGCVIDLFVLTCGWGALM